ncbi:MAG: HPr family phosphocarrier protein [Lachnospiraceae bacterium]|nr:HPr family phosphocarrier protein [Lachnospiraceae bacterium]
MKEFTYTITDPEGIHARPAGILVKQAKEYACDVKIGKDGKEVNAKAIMGIMSLGAKCGMDVTIKCDGEDEDKAAAELETFFKENL